MPSHGQVLKSSYKKGDAIQGTQGARGRAVGAARIPEGHLNPQSKFPKLPRSNHGTLKFQNENPHLQNRCRWWRWSPRSMSVRVWIPKINVREGLGPQDRCRGWFEFPKSMAKRAHNFSKAQSQCTRWHLVHWFWLYSEHRILITINLFKRCLIRSWNQYIILIRLILKSIGIHTKSHLKINPYLTRKNQKKTFIFGGQKIKQINAALRV